MPGDGDTRSDAERKMFVDVVAADREDVRKDVEKFTTHYRQMHSASEQGALSIARDTIRNGFLLNGGGLVAIPAILALFKLDAVAVLQPIVVTAGLFTAGLAASWLASFCGFFSMISRSDAVMSWKNAVEAATIHGRYRRDTDPTTPEQSVKEDREGHYLFRRAVRLQVAGIVFCFLAFALFTAGAAVGGLSVYKSQGRTAVTSVPPSAVVLAPSSGGTEGR
jgi:hypothetical protein